MAVHAMIDIETLDFTPSSVVLSVGAVKFDPYTNTQPYNRKLWRPGIDEQVDKGRTISDSTLEWWAKQDEHVKEVTFTEEGRIPVGCFMSNLNKYLVGVDKIWCQGPQFDMVILEDMYVNFEHHHNWAFWQVCDSRTLFNMMPVEPRKAIQENLHSADDDAYWQAVCVQQCFEHFGVKPR